MQIVFFATPQFASPILQALNNRPEVEVIAVVTQPDRPFGRKKQLTPPPIKVEAQKLNIPIYQPENSQELESITEKFKNADFFVVIAFGMLFRQKSLEAPKIAPINIHLSLLPQYRGASPTHQTILNGDTKTGISFMKMVKKMDAGPIYQQIEVNVQDQETTPELTNRLAKISSDHIFETLNQIKENKLKAEEQNHSRATFCTKIKKKDGAINWNKSAKSIHNQIRAYATWPGSFTEINGQTVKIIEAEYAKEPINGQPGKINLEKKKLSIEAKSGSIWPQIVQPQGKKAMPVADFTNGLKNFN